jgi:4-amino-4-deoxy-L-arabinose transferase-like glycosyltransferase
LSTFAIDSSASDSSYVERARARLPLAWLVALVIWALFACFNRLGEAPVFITNEAREGVYARAMLASGNFVAPSVPNHLENGEWIPDKPPLFHWLAAGAAWMRSQAAFHQSVVSGAELARQFDEWTLRAPSALAASLLIFSTVVAGASLVGGRAALLGGAMLLTTFFFSYQARFGRVDMLLTSLATLATLFAGRAMIERRPWRLCFAGVFAGLATLTKGPLGIVLPTLACAGFLALAPRVLRLPRTELRALPWRAAFGAALAVALPWYGLANWASRGAVTRSHLFAENFEQFVGMGGRMHESFYLLPWLIDSLPWNVLALFALGAVWRRREPGAVFCSIWWIVVLAFFQIAAYKRRAYLLPALPAEALIAGWYVDRVVLSGVKLPPLESSRCLPWAARPAVACIVAALVGAIAGPAAMRAATGQASLGPLDAAVGCGGTVACLIAVGASVLAARKRDWGGALVALFACLGVFYAVVFPTVMLVEARRLSPKSLVERIEKSVPAGRDLWICGIGADTSLVLLFYLSEPERTKVEFEGSCVATGRGGFYLLSAVEWSRAARGPNASLWREHFSSEVRGLTARTPIVFAERMAPALTEASASAGGPSGLSQ